MAAMDAQALDFEYASVDALADIGDEAEVRALGEQVAQLSSERAALRTQVLRSEALASKLEARRGVLRTNTARLFAEAKALVEERDAELRRLRMAGPGVRAPAAPPPRREAAHSTHAAGGAHPPSGQAMPAALGPRPSVDGGRAPLYPHQRLPPPPPPPRGGVERRPGRGHC